MEAAQENNVKRHQKQQLSFNSLQVVLAIGMVAVGAMVSNIILKNCNFITLSYYDLFIFHTTNIIKYFSFYPTLYKV